jgi:hypothetical protein
MKRDRFLFSVLSLDYQLLGYDVARLCRNGRPANVSPGEVLRLGSILQLLKKN